MTITDPLCSTNGVPWDVHNYADESGGYMNLLDATGTRPLIDQTMPMEDARDGFAAMAEGDVFGKIVFTR